MVTFPGFSERIFEFAFNAEFAGHYSTVLAACPSVPSLQEEKHCGHDVQFQLKCRGGAIESLFLQHKVARFVDSKCGSNAHFYESAGGPYFAFQLDKDQYNLIRSFAARRSRRIYYCAPLITSRREIDDAFLGNRIRKNSIWIDVRNASSIEDNTSHSIVYSEDGSSATRFSANAEPLEVSKPVEFKIGQADVTEAFAPEAVRQLYTDVFEAHSDWWPESRRRPAIKGETDMKGGSDSFVPESMPLRRLSSDAAVTQLAEETANLLATWFGLTWLLVCKHAPES